MLRQLWAVGHGRPACSWSEPFQMPLYMAHTLALHAPGRKEVFPPMLLCTAHTLPLLQVGHMLQLLGQPRDVLELSYCLGPPSEVSTLGSIACSRLPAAPPEAGGAASGAAAEAAATTQQLAAPLLAPAAPPLSRTTRRQSHLPGALPESTLDEGSLPEAAHRAGPDDDAQDCCAAPSRGILPGPAGSQQRSRPNPGQLEGSGAQQQQGQRALLAPEALHMSPLMKQQSELLDALPDMELGVDLEVAAGGLPAAAAPHGAAANCGGAVAMQLTFGHAGDSRDDPAAQHTQGAAGPAEGSQPAAFQGTEGAGGQGSAGGGFCFARTPLQPRVATQVTSPAGDPVPRDRRPAKRKRSAQRLLGSGPGQGVLGTQADQVGGSLHSRCPSKRAAACDLPSWLMLDLCHGSPRAAFFGAGRWLHAVAACCQRCAAGSVLNAVQTLRPGTALHAGGAPLPHAV